MNTQVSCQLIIIIIHQNKNDEMMKCETLSLFLQVEFFFLLNTHQFFMVKGEAQTLQHGDEDDDVFSVGWDGTKHARQLP